MVSSDAQIISEQVTMHMICVIVVVWLNAEVGRVPHIVDPLSRELYQFKYTVFMFSSNSFWTVSVAAMIP